MKEFIKTDGYKTNLYSDEHQNIFAFGDGGKFNLISKSETELPFFSEGDEFTQEEIDEHVSCGGLFPVVVDKYGSFHKISQSVVTMEKVAEAVKKFMFETQNFSGESLHQCDSGLIDAPSCLSTIIDDIMQVTYLHKLEGILNGNS